MKYRKCLYFDHQATTPVAEKVLSKMIPYFRESFGNSHSSDHSFGWESSRAVQESALSISSLIGADSDEIIFTSGATEANNLALLGLARSKKREDKRNRIIVSTIEHKSVLAVVRLLSHQFGFHVDYLNVGKDGRISVTELEELLDDDVLVVSIMAVNNEIGTIQDIKSISEAIRESGAVFHCDASQAPIAIEMGFIAQNVDLLSLSAHKMYGPQGVGALYVSRELQNRIEPLVYGGGQQNGLRSGTIPVPLCVGMGAAAEYFGNDEVKIERALLRGRRDRFVEGLNNMPWSISLNGPTSDFRHPGNANICFGGFSAKDILGLLQPNLAAATGSACTSGIPEPSHVLRAIGLSGDDADSSIRFSLGFSTSDSDIDEAVNYISNALSNLKTIF